ncbi:hypothetical protein [Modestobacter marinus]|uniref:hypothetical protein n=1 Tax=Modestobacter marinus TaxID=477641 RepID=UPI001C975CBA|nr:hypothetical protein [Modestobacter marinus]
MLQGLTAAGFSAGLAVHLLEPAAVLDGWRGADARVAAGEVAAVTQLTAALRNALAAGVARLVSHHELWLQVAGRVAELREEQRVAFRAARARLAVLLAPTAAAAVPVPPGATALVADVAAGRTRIAGPSTGRCSSRWRRTPERPPRRWRARPLRWTAPIPARPPR